MRWTWACCVAVLCIGAGPAHAMGWDTSFGGDGVLLTSTSGGTSRSMTGVAVLPDGDILASGWDQSSRPTWGDLVVERANPDGTLDSAFGSGGGVLLPVGAGQAHDVPEDLALASDGKFVVGGSEDNINANRQTLFVSRFLANGTLDAEFSGDGLAFADVAGGHDWEVGRAVDVQSDGKVVLAGSARAGDDSRPITVVRWTAAGALDPDFGSGGVARIPVVWSDDAWDMAIQADGKLVVVGSGANGMGIPSLVILRLTSTGAPDPSFGTAGVVRLTQTPAGQPLSRALGVAVQSDGRIVAVGQATTSAGGTDWAILRLTAAGALDSSFSEDGVQVAAIGSGTAYDAPESLTLDANGRAVVAGWTASPDTVALARLRTDGSLDPAFDGDGKHVATRILNHERVAGLTLDGSGRPVIVGSSDTLLLVGRFTLDPEPPPEGGGGGESGGGAGGSGAPPVSSPPVVPVDRTPPEVGLVAPRSISGAKLSRGLALGVTCNEAAQAVASLELSRRDAARLGLSRRARGGPIVVGRGSGAVRAGVRSKLVVRLGASARRLTSVRPTKLTLRLRVTDGAGNATSISRRIRVSR